MKPRGAAKIEALLHQIPPFLRSSQYHVPTQGFYQDGRGAPLAPQSTLKIRAKSPPGSKAAVSEISGWIRRLMGGALCQINTQFCIEYSFK